MDWQTKSFEQCQCWGLHYAPLCMLRRSIRRLLFRMRLQQRWWIETTSQSCCLLSCATRLSSLLRLTNSVSLTFLQTRFCLAYSIHASTRSRWLRRGVNPSKSNWYFRFPCQRARWWRCCTMQTRASLVWQVESSCSITSAIRFGRYLFDVHPHHLLSCCSR